MNPVDTLTQNVYTIDSTEPPSKGIILTAPFNFNASVTAVTPGLLLIMDQSGKVLQKLTTPGNPFDFERWIINGETRYTYLVIPLAFYALGALVCVVQALVFTILSITYVRMASASH